MKTIGVIAGNGNFPLLVAGSARQDGLGVAICAIEGEADPALEPLADHFLWTKLGELGKLIRFFQSHGVGQAVMAGKVRKVSLFSGQVRPDLEMVMAMTGIRDWKDDSLLRAIVSHLGKKGIEILDSTSFIKNQMPAAGVLTKRRPDKREEEDIEFGWKIAKELGRLDIGQTVVVKDKAVLALEAIEGTDEAIRRGGTLGNEGSVVVKVAKPGQDMRFDVPAIGLSTIQTMIEAGARTLALEAGKTIFLDKDQTIDLADRNRIAIVLK